MSPQRGNIDFDQIRSTSRQGSGSGFQMFAGSAPTAGHLAVYDANGNVTDGGAVPSGDVLSVFGRTGAVVAQLGDYQASQVLGAVDQGASYANPPWITSLAWSKITGAPAAGVSSVFGRTGSVFAQAGDYVASQVTNAVDQTMGYANPSWITSLAYSKITGAPAAGQPQTPWAQNINAAGFNLGSVSAIGIGAAVQTGYSLYISASSPQVPILVVNSASNGSASFFFGNDASQYFGFGMAGSASNPAGAAFLNMQNGQPLVFISSSTERMRLTGSGQLGIGVTAPGYTLDVNGDCNISGAYRVNGTPISAGGQPQTPWAQNINAANFNLTSVGYPLAVGNNGSQSAYGQTTNPSLILGPTTTGSGWGESTLCSNATASGAPCGVLNFCNFAITPVDKRIAVIGGFVDPQGANYGYMSFYTTANNIMAERMRITSAGNVGIGVTAPAYSVDVNGDVNCSGVFRVGGTPLALGQPQTPWAQNINAANFNLSNSGAIGIGSAASGTFPLFINQAGTGYTAVFSNTNANASAALYMTSNAGAFFVIGMAGTTAANAPGSAYFNTGNVTQIIWMFGNTERMRLTATGLLGIQNNNPAYSIDAVGDCNITGVYRINGTPIVTGVSSFNTRTGAVMPAANDYSFSQVSGSLAMTQIAQGSATSGQVITWNGSAWAPATPTGGSGTPAAPTGSVQFNNAGAFGGSANLFWDNTNSRLGIGTSTPQTTLDVSDGTRHLVVDLRSGATGALAVGADVGCWANSLNLMGAYGTGTAGQGVNICYFSSPSWYAALSVANVSSGYSNLLLMQAGGNVGIGTTSPLALLDLGGAAGLKQLIYSGSSGYQIGFGVSLGQLSNSLSIVAPGAGGSLSGIDFVAPNQSTWPYSSYTSRMVILSTGNVGIGTTSPPVLFDVSGASSSPSVTAWNDIAAITGVTTGVSLGIGQMSASPYSVWLQTRQGTGGATFPIALNPLGGNVGIGTTSPAHLLDVISASAIAATISSTGSAGAVGIGSYQGVAIIQGYTDHNATGGANLTLQPSGGNVGIGGSSAACLLDVSSTGSGYMFRLDNYTAGRTYGEGIDGSGNWFFDDLSAGQRRLTVPVGGGLIVQYGTLTVAAGNCNISGQYQVNGVPIGPGGITTFTAPSRALNVVYQNGTGRPMLVTMSATTPAGQGLFARCDGGNPPGTQVAAAGGAAAQYSLSFWVLPGYFYEVLATSSTLNTWSEWY